MAEGYISDQVFKIIPSALDGELDQTRGARAFAGSSGTGLHPPAAADGEADPGGKPKQRRGGRGRPGYWSNLVSDSRPLALPADKPLTSTEKAFLAARHRRRGLPLGTPMDNPDYLWLARRRLPRKRLSVSLHYLPREWDTSHVTILKLEKKSAKLLVDYYLRKGLLVLKDC